MWKLSLELLRDKLQKIFSIGLAVLQLFIDVYESNKAELDIANSTGVRDLIYKSLVAMNYHFNSLKPDTLTLIKTVFSNFHRQQLCFPADLMAILIKKHKQIKSPKQVLVRIRLLIDLLRTTGNDVIAVQILQFGVRNLEQANKDVREEARELVVSVQELIGGKRVMKFLEDNNVRKGHMQYFKDKFGGKRGEEARPPNRSARKNTQKGKKPKRQQKPKHKIEK